MPTILQAGGDWADSYYNPVAVGNSGTAKTIDFSLGNVFRVTLTGNCTFTFLNKPVDGAVVRFELTQDGTGSRTVTWPASVAWPAATAPTLTTTAAHVDHVFLHYVDAGPTYRGSSSLNYAA